MATINKTDHRRVYEIRKFLGLNECADGDTQIAMGEAGEMQNWQVTPHHHLRIRPGFRTQVTFDRPVRGLWTGYAAGVRKTVCAADGGLWELSDLGARRIGDIRDAPTTMFGFGGRVYFLNGYEYLVWDGEGFVDTVDGYVPLVVTAMAPGGGGTTVENINRLTGRRRCRFSADGEATVYRLPEKGLLSVEKILIGTEQRTGGWTLDRTAGTITFDTAPEAGSSNVEVWYTMPNTLRSLVEGMRYAEQFNGAADTRVFLYGDGTAKAIYCGVTEAGQASAEYFPDLYEIRIGAENSPITGMIKYYDRLMSYKADGGAYSTRYELTELADGSVIPGFLTVSIHREIGHDAMGQVRLVQNVPRTLYGGQLYDWVFASYATRDERNAGRISDRVQKTLAAADPARVFCFDDDTRQEYYLFCNDEAGTALVHNYGIDVWYRYTGLPVVCASRTDSGLLFGLSDGRVVQFAEQYPNDDGCAIEAVYATGHLDFDRTWERKDAMTAWISVKPTAHAELLVEAESDRRSNYPAQPVSMRLAAFARWSFLTNRSPQLRRLRLKLRRFVRSRLLLKSSSPSADTVVLGMDLQVRYGAGAK